CALTQTRPVAPAGAALFPAYARPPPVESALEPKSLPPAGVDPPPLHPTASQASVTRQSVTAILRAQPAPRHRRSGAELRMLTHSTFVPRDRFRPGSGAPYVLVNQGRARPFLYLTSHSLDT